MPKEALLHRTAQALRRDRLEVYRDFADAYQNYCFFVSLYEIAFQVHQEALPPRLVETVFEWHDFQTRRHDGSVEVSEVLPLTVMLANYFGLHINEVIGFPAVLEFFQSIHPAHFPTMLMHVESRTNLPRSDVRLKLFAQDNWQNALIVTFLNQVMSEPSNQLEKLPWQPLTHAIARPEPPYLVMMWKQVK